MKNKYLIVTLFFVIVASAGSFYYFNYINNDVNTDVWELIPANAVSVYQSKKTIQNWNNLQSQPLWQSLKNIPFFSELDEDLITLDSISGKNGKLDLVLNNNPLYISIHRTAKESLGYVFYINALDLIKQDVIYSTINHFEKNPNFQKDSRIYLKETIHEFKDKKTGQLFSYINFKEHFIGSFSPVLIEDVIRNVEEQGERSFKKSNFPLFEIADLNTDEENIYINNTKFSDIVSVFFHSPGEKNMWNNFGSASKLSFSIKENEILANGYTLAGTNKQSFLLKTFEDQKSGAIKMKRFIPNRTATLYHYSFENGGKWYNKLREYWEKNEVVQIETLNQLKSDHKLDAEKFYQWMGGEIGLATLESMDAKKPDKLLVLKSNDVNEAYNQVNRLAAQAEGDLDSAFIENFSGNEIRLLNIQEFPSKLLGAGFAGFQEVYYMVLNDYLIFGNSIQVLKSLLVDIEADNNWEKSVAYNKFFESSLGEANITFISNINRSWSNLSEGLNASWQQKLNQQSSSIKNFGFVALQFENSDKGFYTSFVLNHQSAILPDRKNNNFVLAKNFSVEAPIITMPFFLKRGKENSSGIVFQDSSFYLYKVSDQGELIWKDSIGESIMSDVFQIDYYKNGKIQYVFLTREAIHAIQSDGGYLEGFPKKHNLDPQFFNVIDYDHSKNYRFLLAAKNGDLYMFDKDFNPLDGWNPKVMHHKPAITPRHLRIRGKDLILSLQEDGILNVMTRKGELYPNFPVNLKGRFFNNLYIEVGPTFAQTILTTVSEMGELLKVNLEGKVIKSEQLYRPSKETRFTLCVDEFQNDFIIARQELGILTLLDRKGEVVLEKDYITSGVLEVQYFNAGFERQIYAVTDKVQEFTYLYDQKGNLIHFRPLESGHKIALRYTESSGTYEVMTNYGSQFSVIDFKR